jgi:hypothetical protein
MRPRPGTYPGCGQRTSATPGCGPCVARPRPATVGSTIRAPRASGPGQCRSSRRFATWWGGGWTFCPGFVCTAGSSATASDPANHPATASGCFPWPSARPFSAPQPPASLRPAPTCTRSWSPACVARAGAGQADPARRPAPAVRGGRLGGLVVLAAQPSSPIASARACRLLTPPGQRRGDLVDLRHGRPQLRDGADFAGLPGQGQCDDFGERAYRGGQDWPICLSGLGNRDPMKPAVGGEDGIRQPQRSALAANRRRTGGRADCCPCLSVDVHGIRRRRHGMAPSFRRSTAPLCRQPSSVSSSATSSPCL